MGTPMNFPPPSPSLPLSGKGAGWRCCVPRRQAGAILIIALIVLAAMTLAGIAIMRSVDTSNLIAGNLAFRQSALQASDNGIEQAYQWLLANRPSLVNTNAGVGYYSSQPGVFNVNDPTTWAGAPSTPPDAGGNTVSYLIHRLCTQPEVPYNGVNQSCALDNPAATAPPPGAGDSFAIGAPGFLQDPMVYYRITVRTVGPRNTTSFVQAMVAIAL